MFEGVIVGWEQDEMEAESNWVLKKRWMPSDPPEQYNGEASVAEFENKLVEICLDSGFLLWRVGMLRFWTIYFAHLTQIIIGTASFLYLNPFTRR